MKRNEMILIALLGILAVAYLALRTDGRIGYDLPEWKKLEGDKLSSVSYGTGERMNTLTRSAGGWTIPGGKQADPDRIRRIVEVLEDLSFLDKLSDQDDYKRYKLDDLQGTTLRIESEKDIRELIFGKQAPGGGTYVRLPGTKGVFSVNRDLTALFPSDPSELRNREVLSFDPAGLQSFSLTRGDKTIAIKKEGDKWFRDGQETEEKDPLVMMLPALSSLKCSSFLDEEAAGDVTLELRLIGEKNQTLYVYDTADDGYRAASSDAEGKFVLSKYIVDGWLKAFDN